MCSASAPLELDHFRGRREPQTLENCWTLCSPCHRQKTDNRPSAFWWQLRFKAHAARFGYAAEVERCEARITVLWAKGFRP